MSRNKAGVENVARRTVLRTAAMAAGGTTVAVGAPRGPAARKRALKSSKAALPIGPYSQGIQVGNLIFVAGEKGINPRNGKIVPGGIAAETRQTFENIKAILAEAGATLEDAVACTVHMTDLSEFNEMNSVYATYFAEAPPGRTTVQVAALPAGARIEITIVAAV